MLYSDATTLDHFGKSSRHPIFVTIGNIPSYLRNKPEAKALVGIIPILEGSKQQKKPKNFVKLFELLFINALKFFLHLFELKNRQVYN